MPVPADEGPLPPWCTRLTTEFSASNARAIALAQSLDVAQLDWRPSSDAWSVGQCLEHLARANEVYLAAIAAALGDRHRGEVEEIVPGWLGRWFIRSYMEPSPESRRRRAPRKIAPGANADPAVLDRFLRSNATAREVVLRARHYDVNRLRFRNPFVPLLRFTVGTGLEILSAHERRHLLQAEQVRASAGFPC